MSLFDMKVWLLGTHYPALILIESITVCFSLSCHSFSHCYTYTHMFHPSVHVTLSQAYKAVVYLQQIQTGSKKLSTNFGSGIFTCVWCFMQNSTCTRVRVRGSVSVCLHWVWPKSDVGFSSPSNWMDRYITDRKWGDTGYC